MNAISSVFILSFLTCDPIQVYDYEKYRPTGGNTPNGMEFVVMQRVNDGSIGQLASAAAQNGPYVLGFNEPDNAGQANLSPQQAANL